MLVVRRARREVAALRHELRCTGSWCWSALVLGRTCIEVERGKRELPMDLLSQEQVYII